VNLFIVIPAYNEQNSISKVIKKCLNHVSNIIVVDDHSSDDTFLKAKLAGAYVLKLEKNKGYDRALEEGINLAISLGAEKILTLDADGQHPTDLIPVFFDTVKTGEVDLALGIRNKLPRISERVFAVFTNLFFGVSDITCGMKCYSSEIYKKYGFKSSIKSIGTFLALKILKNNIGFKTISVPIRTRLDNSRYGNNILSELKILKSLVFSFFY